MKSENFTGEKPGYEVPVSNFEHEAIFLNTPFFKRFDKKEKKAELSFGGKIMGFVKRQDMFGDPVRLFFKGEDTVKSKFGGLISVFFIVSMAFYIITSTSSLVNSDDSNLSSILLKSDAVLNNQHISLPGYGVKNEDIKFGINFPIDTSSDFDLEEIANPYFVFKAYIIDPEHQNHKQVSVYRCDMSNNTDRN